MVIATLASLIVLLSAVLVALGIRTVARDTFMAVAEALRIDQGLYQRLAFAALWVMIFWLSFG